jgi:hypothetical protein
MRLIFATRADLSENVHIEAVLVDAGATEALLATVPLVDDINGDPTSEWMAYRFYAMILKPSVPKMLNIGTYTLRITIAGDNSLCAPDCTVDAGEVTIR